MKKKALTEDQREHIRQGVNRFYASPEGQAEMAAKKGKAPGNKGLPGSEPWNKGLKGTCKHTPESRKRIGEANRKPILQYSKGGKFIKKWPSIIEACHELGLSHQSIWYSATKRRKTGGGYIWHYGE